MKLEGVPEASVTALTSFWGEKEYLQWANKATNRVKRYRQIQILITKGKLRSFECVSGYEINHTC